MTIKPNYGIPSNSKGIEMLIRALKNPPNDKMNTGAQQSFHSHGRWQSCDLANYYPQSVIDAKNAIPELINLLKTRENERDQRVRAMDLHVLKPNPKHG